MKKENLKVTVKSLMSNKVIVWSLCIICTLIVVGGTRSILASKEENKMITQLYELDKHLTLDMNEYCLDLSKFVSQRSLIAEQDAVETETIICKRLSAAYNINPKYSSHKSEYNWIKKQIDEYGTELDNMMTYARTGQITQLKASCNHAKSLQNSLGKNIANLATSIE